MTITSTKQNYQFLINEASQTRPFIESLSALTSALCSSSNIPAGILDQLGYSTICI
ncbi:hypothetical protein [Acinetobacter puyangensis]|uniref:hypothetical protein n=1 Tax=Acinetobacter puyangensis TaxID=1096779 RepID=UPI003A4E1157